MITSHYIGLVLSLSLFLGLAFFTGLNNKAKEEKNNGAIVAGLLMGTLVGGSSTIGTAQLAYTFGMSAWWFTLGGGIACLFLTLLYAKPFRNSHCPTLVGMLRKEYGSKVGIWASILNSVGTFINIIAQLLAASAVVLVAFPEKKIGWAVLIAACFMAIYVVFGGTKGAGIVGILKLTMVYISMICCGMLALKKIGGVNEFLHLFKTFSEETNVNYSSLFARGLSIDLSACFSLILGVLTTQTYAQAIISGKSDRQAQLGGLISAIMIPPIGILGIIVGMYMRSATDPSVFVPKQALTQFVIDNLSPVLGGIVLGTLFITSVGTGAGLALGIATMINNDIIQNITKKFKDPLKSNILTKVLIVAVLLSAASLSTGALGDTIFRFAFMSMGLRGTVVFLPLAFALWKPGAIPTRYAFLSVIVAPISVLLFGTVFNELIPIDSLFVGMIVSAIIMCVGYMVNKPICSPTHHANK